MYGPAPETLSTVYLLLGSNPVGNVPDVPVVITKAFPMADIGILAATAIKSAIDASVSEPLASTVYTVLIVATGTWNPEPIIPPTVASNPAPDTVFTGTVNEELDTVATGSANPEPDTTVATRILNPEPTGSDGAVNKSFTVYPKPAVVILTDDT